MTSRGRSFAGMVVSLLALALVGCESTGTPRPAADPSPSEAGAPAAKVGAWVRWAEMPLTPRHAPAVAYLPGDPGRLVVVGGLDGPPCPPNADCAYDPSGETRDGAVLNLTTGDWTPITTAPRNVVAWPGPVVIGDELFLLTSRRLLVWNSTQDTWREIAVPGPQSWPNLVAQGDNLILASPTDERGVHPDRVYDTNAGTWSRLPRDPLKPAFDRALTATPKGLVLTAKTILPNGNPEDPALVKAAVLNDQGRWRTLPASEQLGGSSWTWSGTRMVDPTPGGADGGQVNNYGRVIPFGGVLDPATGTWSQLIKPPDQLSEGWRVDAVDGPLMAVSGRLYNDLTESWSAIPPRPAEGPESPGAAVWADGTLFVLGGQTWDNVKGAPRAAEVYSTQVWALTPAQTSD